MDSFIDGFIYKILYIKPSNIPYLKLDCAELTIIDDMISNKSIDRILTNDFNLEVLKIGAISSKI